MFRILDLSEKEDWKKIIKSAYKYDFYHTYDYHLLAFEQNEGVPRLFYYTYNDEYIALPLLERLISNVGNYKDFTSVYGYAGPVSNKKKVSPECVKGFTSELEKFFIDEKVVSVFSRLHPLIDQNYLLNGIGEVENLNKTVTIDLENDLDEQRRKYRKSNKSEINKLRRTVSCSNAQDEDELREYIEMYYDNMKRLNANKRYFFNNDYFNRLFSSQDFKSEVILAKEDNEVMAGAMFIYTQDIIQYHLAATKEKYLKRTPMKLILDEMRIKGTNLNYKQFHLGGGVGNKEDSLLRFKSGFSDKYCDFNVWKFIIDKSIYNKLVEDRKEQIRDYNYFPLYRG